MRPNNLKRQELQATIKKLEAKRHKVWVKELPLFTDEDRKLLANFNKEIDTLELELKNTPLEPEEGIGATIGWNGDAYPYTIHKVSEDLKTLWASEDQFKYTGTPLQWGEEYLRSYMNFTNNNEDKPDQWTRYTLRKNGRYVKKGCDLNDVWGTLWIGQRDYRQSPEF